MTNTFYLDDPEEGPHHSTSHPVFNQLAKEDFFLDCTDEFSPFGNDQGAESHYELEDWYREYDPTANLVSFMLDYIDGLGFTYQCKEFVKELDLARINWLLQKDRFFIDCMDQTIIAFAFGQLKIEGKIDAELKEIGLVALERQKLVTLQKYADNELDLSKLYKIVNGETTRANEKGNTNHLDEVYLDRLEIMKQALEQALV